MAVNVVMPKAGLTMTHGTIGEWLVQEGSRVQKGDRILLIENEKTTVEATSPHDGILHIAAAPGEEYPIGETIALLAEHEEEYRQLRAAQAEGETARQEMVAPDNREDPGGASPPPIPQREETRVKASPNARRVARGIGVDLALVTGTGPGGRVVERDIWAFQKNAPKQAPAARTASSTRVAMNTMRRTIAKHMVESLQTKAQATAGVEIDVTKLVRLHDELRASAEAIGCKITYTDLFVRLLVPVLQKHPYANACLEGSDILLHSEINLNIAVAVDGGLQVPVIRAVQNMSLSEISRAVQTVSRKARENRMTPEDTEGGTFTITNVGMYPVDFGTPILNGNQSAILGLGRIIKKPVVLEDDTIAVHPMMTIFLTFDHQVFDGAEACGILQDIKNFAEHPELLLV